MTALQSSLPLLRQHVQAVPGAVQGEMRRHLLLEEEDEINEEAVLQYHPAIDASSCFLALQFTIRGHAHCTTDGRCGDCAATDGCRQPLTTLDTVYLHFEPAVLKAYASTVPSNNALADALLRFEHPDAFTQAMPLTQRLRTVLNTLLDAPYTGSLQAIHFNAQADLLLLYALDALKAAATPEPAFMGCRFLSYEADREKVVKARDILLSRLGEPLTIKELSRKVAMNECYLKKGFKAMFGTTIFDFYQTQRMQHARYLLYEKGLTVTEVSDLLGYSSISHFSTAFKKHTGLKPCELLLR